MATVAKTKPLTNAEKKWIDEVNAVLAKCPSKRLGFATIGDPTVFIFDVTRYDEVCKKMERDGGYDFAPACRAIGALFSETLDFPESVESTA